MYQKYSQLTHQTTGNSNSHENPTFLITLFRFNISHRILKCNLLSRPSPPSFEEPQI